MVCMMMRYPEFLIIVALCSLVVVLPIVEPVMAEGPIVINQDGSVSGTDKIQRNGDFYYLTDDIEISSPEFGSTGISVQHDNIILDGNNFSIIETEDTTSCGICLGGRFNVTIQNFHITHFSVGIIFGTFAFEVDSYSFNNTVVGNTITVTDYPPSFQTGIWVGTGSSGNRIVDNTVTGSNDRGIMLYKSNSTYLSGNILTGNDDGLVFEGSGNNVLRNNRIYGNKRNIMFHLTYSSYVQDIDTSNTVNGKPIYYWVNQHNRVVPVDAGFVALSNCSGINVQDLNITANSVGIQLYLTTNSVIKSNHLKDNAVGISITSSHNINVTDNSLQSNSGGISFRASSNSLVTRNNSTDHRNGIGLRTETRNVSVTNNNIEGNDQGLEIIYAFENVVSGNNFTDNGSFGIYMLDTDYNVVVGNSFIGTSGFAIRWSNSQNNTFYHNNFINNSVGSSGLQVSNPWLLGSGNSEGNVWDNGQEGNYWSDLPSRYPNATELDTSGIWDTPFFINPMNIDGFPLTEPVDIGLVAIPEFPSVNVFFVIISVIAVTSLVFRNRLSGRWKIKE